MINFLGRELPLYGLCWMIGIVLAFVVALLLIKRAGLDSFDLASGVVTATYCVDSGKLVTDACRHDLRGSRIETGYFTMETAPTTACDVHVLVDYDKVTGAVACADCPPENITQVALVRVEDRDFPAQVTVSDAQYVYREWEPKDGVTDSTSEPFFAALIEDEHYCGTSGVTTRAVNSFCFEHYVEHTEETETETEDVTDIPTPESPDETPTEQPSAGNDPEEE
jgi:hypothetical protein